MKKYKMAEALNGISDELLLEAAQMTKKRSNPAGKLLRVAAIAAAVAILITAVALWPADENYVTGPGVLVVRAYAAGTEEFTEENSIVLEEGITLPPKYAFDNGISLVNNGMSLLLSIPEDAYKGMAVSFECVLSDGAFEQDLLTICEGLSKEDRLLILEDSYLFWSKAYLGDHFTAENNQRMYWVPYTKTFDHDNREYENAGTFMGEQAFADIIIRADDYIVGYAVIEFYGDAETFSKNGVYSRYYARMLKIVSFPQVDGRYQNVSEHYVNEQFQWIHETAKL